MSIQHVSVDFWHTLAEPNLEYPPLRNEILGRAFGVSPEQAAVAYKTLKNKEEARAVSEGTVASSTELCHMFCDAFESDISEHGWIGANIDLRAAFYQNPPVVCKKSIERLWRIKTLTSMTLSIGSNTNFIIGGENIQRLLPERLFKFQIYSDIVGVCKPNPEFFTRIGMFAASMNRQVSGPQNIIHIGDSEQCDCNAAVAVGMIPAAVTPNLPLHKILEQLENEYANGRDLKTPDRSKATHDALV